MKLADWLATEKLSDEEFAARIDTTRQAVWRYRTGRIPKREVMSRISQATNGDVQPADFYDLQVAP